MTDAETRQSFFAFYHFNETPQGRALPSLHFITFGGLSFCASLKIYLKTLGFQTFRNGDLGAEPTGNYSIKSKSPLLGFAQEQ